MESVPSKLEDALRSSIEKDVQRPAAGREQTSITPLKSREQIEKAIKEEEKKLGQELARINKGQLQEGKLKEEIKKVWQQSHQRMETLAEQLQTLDVAQIQQTQADWSKDLLLRNSIGIPILQTWDSVANDKKAIATFDEIILGLNKEATELKEQIKKGKESPGVIQETLNELGRQLKENQDNLTERQKEREQIRQNLVEARTYLKGLLTDWKEYKETEDVKRETGKKNKKST